VKAIKRRAEGKTDARLIIHAIGQSALLSLHSLGSASGRLSMAI
jgi:hypothetical protein